MLHCYNLQHRPSSDTCLSAQDSYVFYSSVTAIVRHSTRSRILQFADKARRLCVLLATLSSQVVLLTTDFDVMN